MGHSRYRRIGSLLLVLAFAGQSPAVEPAQNTQTQAAAAGLCDPQTALALIQQQVNDTKNIDQPLPRIIILSRAAGLLWPYRRESARAIFLDAFEQASKLDEQEAKSGGEGPNANKAGVGAKAATAERRWSVIRDIARYDPEWAERLTARVMEEGRAASDANADTPPPSTDAGAQLINLALSLLPSNPQAATNFARSSLRYPANEGLARFLFKLAESEQSAADQFYIEAVRAHSAAPVAELLYLSAFPFALNNPVGPQGSSTYLEVPPKFSPNANGQRLFLTTLLRRGAKLQSTAQAQSTSESLSEPAQFFFALQSLEPLIAKYQPSLLEQAVQSREAARALLNADAQTQLRELAQGQQEKAGGFESLIEKAERENQPDQKDRLISQVVVKASGKDELDAAERLLEKMSDSELRPQLLNLVNFKRVKLALRAGMLEEATQLIKKVDEPEHRAYLSMELVSKALEKQFDDKTRALELLDNVAKMTRETDVKVEKARTLLGTAHLYTKVDYGRSQEVFGDAVETINKLGSPDLTSPTLFRRLRARRLNIFAGYQIAGFSLENAFREMSLYNFDAALFQANRLEDKPLRATAVLALAAQCLETAAKQERQTRQKSQKKRSN